MSDYRDILEIVKSSRMRDNRAMKGFNVKLYNEIKDLSILSEQLDLDKPLFLDTETLELYKNMTLCQLMQEHWKEPYLFCVLSDTEEQRVEKIKALYEIIKDAQVICHNTSFDLEVFRHDMQLNCNPFKNFDDTLLLSKLLLFRELEGFSLDNCLRLVNGFDAYYDNGIDKKEMQKIFMKLKSVDEIKGNPKALIYASLDVKYMPRFWDFLMQKKQDLLKEGIDISYVYELDKKFIDLALFWSPRGLPFDKEAMALKKGEVEKELKDELAYLPSDLNVNSPKQVKEYMQGALQLFAKSYDELNLKIAWYEHESRESLAIMKARKLIKSLDFLDRFGLKESTFELNAKNVDKESRIRGYFAPLTVSGRAMCNGAKDDKSDNIMQIPRNFHDLVGFKYINKIEGRNDESNKKYLVYADYAQLELRCLCCVTGDETLNKLFREGKDLHKYAATRIYGINEDEVNKEQRTMAKFSNFSLSYGASPRAFRDILFKMGDRKPPNEGECARIIKAWKDAYPKVKKWQENAKYKFFRGFNEFHTANGRPYLARLYTDYMAIRVQGTGAECAKLALYRLLQNYHKDFKGTLDFHLLCFIHDSMIIEVEGLEMGKKVAKALADSMVLAWHESIVELPINDLPMPTDASVMENWDESKAIYTYTNEGFRDA